MIDQGEPYVSNEQSAYWACVEMDAGRLDWLRFHITNESFQIDTLVAKKLLELIVGAHPEFQLALIRNPNLNPKSKSPLVINTRDLELAEEVARRGGFKHGMRDRICDKIADEQVPKLKGSTVRKAAQRYKDIALKSLGLPAPPKRRSQNELLEIPE